MEEHETFKTPTEEHERQRMLALNYQLIELPEESKLNQESEDLH